MFGLLFKKRVWRYQRGNQNPYIEEEQTTQWSKEKVQKDKQRSTKYTYNDLDAQVMANGMMGWSPWKWTIQWATSHTQRSLGNRCYLLHRKGNILDMIYVKSYAKQFTKNSTSRHIVKRNNRLSNLYYTHYSRKQQFISK
jgi:hypothetical protein